MAYVEVAGQNVWHEVAGTGDPVVLLHGAFAGADSWFAQTPALVAEGFKVYAPERRGHAHTADVDGPLTYDVMATDTIDYLDQVIGCRAHLVGWSDGAVVALLVAIRRPDLVDRMVVIGQYYNSAGKAKGGMIDQMLTDLEATKGYLKPAYAAVSPDGPDHFDVVFDKTLAMINTEPELELASLAAVSTATLVLQGDRDEVTVAHSLDVAAAIPQGRLAVLPGSHALPIENPGPVNALITSWLRSGAPAALWEPSNSE